MPEFSKTVKQRIRALGAIAHERKLTGALAELEREFVRWREGALDAFELSDRIHAFHDGTAREIWKAYASNAMLDAQVAHDIAAGTIAADEAGTEVLAALEPAIALSRP